MSRYNLLVAISGISMSATCFVGVAAAADLKQLAYGQHLAQECTSCHRGDGRDAAIPSISGWDPASFAETLRYYRDGQRTNPAMVSVAQSLDDKQIEALAAHFATLAKPGRSRPGTRQ